MYIALMEAKHHILNNITRYVSLTEEEKKAVLRIVESRRVRRKQFIVQPGFTCVHQTYVQQGAFRSYFVTSQGAEHTIQFAIEDWFISDFNSYISQGPASLYVEALEDGLIQQIAYDKTEALCLSYPVFERFFRLVAQKAFAFSQKRILSKLEKSAEERFMEFSDRYPAIVRRVPQYALASYLGMSAEFLSKIKNQRHLS